MGKYLGWGEDHLEHKDRTNNLVPEKLNKRHIASVNCADCPRGSTDTGHCRPSALSGPRRDSLERTAGELCLDDLGSGAKCARQPGPAERRRVVRCKSTFRGLLDEFQISL